MSKQIHEFIKWRLQLMNILLESRQFYENETKHICHDLIREVLTKPIGRMITVLRPNLSVRKLEIKKGLTMKYTSSINLRKNYGGVHVTKNHVQHFGTSPPYICTKLQKMAKCQNILPRLQYIFMRQNTGTNLSYPSVHITDFV